MMLLGNRSRDSILDIKMTKEDKEFLAFLFVWLDWQIYQSIGSQSPDFESRYKTVEDFKEQAVEIVKEFDK